MHEKETHQDSLSIARAFYSLLCSPSATSEPPLLPLYALFEISEEIVSSCWVTTTQMGWRESDPSRIESLFIVRRRKRRSWNLYVCGNP